jgi:hypothetical protein
MFLYDKFNINHDRAPESEVIRFFKNHNIPFII